MDKKTVCLINDSFPPTLDGVANVVVNYAKEIQKYGKSIVATPMDPNADDSHYDFEVYRYPSVASKIIGGYRAGMPWSPKILDEIRKENIDVIHAHCPVTSAFMARTLRDLTNKPTILTWHTKYDIDIANAIRSKILQREAVDALIGNVNTFDEVWTVSKGAGENLKSLGYKGEYLVMKNGVDLPKEKLDRKIVDELLKDYEIVDDVPILLFVGRMRWYKGARITIDALKILKDQNVKFHMYFVGSGTDKEEIVAYANSLHLDDVITFYDGIHDRQVLRAWYSRANLFIFPSTFDTNGLVVMEAAACALPAVLVKGSCAAEDAIDNQSGYLIDENSASLAQKLKDILPDLNRIAQVGRNAQNEIYISWEDAVKTAHDRYQIVIDNYKCRDPHRDEKVTVELFDSVSKAMDSYHRLYEKEASLFEKINNEYSQISHMVEEENSKYFYNISEMVKQLKDKIQ